MSSVRACPRCAHSRSWVVAGARFEVWAPSPANRGAPTRSEPRCELQVCERCGHTVWITDPDWMAANAAELGATLRFSE